MIRTSALFGLMALVVFVAIEVTMLVADIGGWLRFAVALAVFVAAAFTLPRLLLDVPDEHVR